MRFINIAYPFKDSPLGFFLNLTETDSDAIKSDLMHLILTTKGERLYMPDFGTNLMKFIFEPSDSKTMSDIKADVQQTVKRYLPNLVVNDVVVTQDPDSEHRATIKIDYTITDDVFQETDVIIINV